ncbi:unnamed protein product [Mytilus coruscus]|uniref:Uncharacterized protein n=1 Tax=Mytilus coruscus TaxID=42192 RepID=A0A6J8DJC9_MYTCO|nr:unnamed protein product [Mytilus coruscus]
MFVEVLFVIVTILTSVYGTCQSLDGQSVPWWILYQQKDRPYFHQYVDSTNSHRIKEHFPEKVDSVLSRVMSSVIDEDEAEYIIYSSDLINVKDIAGKTSIPTYSKWMHGILGTASSWKSGFWILHNNLLFPALTNGVLAVPGSRAWYATTVGDSSADLFYICLTAENKGNMTEILMSIMAGNPFIYKKKLHNYDFLQPYFKEVRSLQTSFGYEMSASIFLNCMYTSRRNVSTNCLFTYAVTTGVGINVFTRPRGMIKHSSTFCYDEQTFSHFDFLKLEKSSTLKSGFTHSIFALSDKTGTTCFGQDVAANAETVAVMICTTLPKVHGSIIKSARLTQWSCRPENGKVKQNTEILNFPVIKQTPFSKPPMQNNKGEKNSETIANNADDEKNEAKFCQMYDCDINEDTENKQELVEIDPLKSPFKKNRKIANW